MECSKANEMMMRFMDGTLSEDDAARLHKHLASCDGCRADFAIYDEIVADFLTLEETPAPDGFVEAVMARVEALEPVSKKVNEKIDNILVAVWGGFSVLFGLGFALSLNREAVMSFLASQPAFAGYMETLAPVAVMVGDFVTGLGAAAETLFTQSLAFLSGAKYIVLAIAACLALATVILTRREKAAAGKKAE